MTNIDSHIRPYKSCDLALLLEAFCLNLPKYFDKKEADDFLYFIKYKRQHFFVMEFEGNPIGCCGYMIDDDKKVANITWVFFHPHAQGKGFGKQLVNYCLEAIKQEKSVKEIIVRTSQKVFLFFESFGFKLRNTHQDYWGKGLHLYYMSMPLV